VTEVAEPDNSRESQGSGGLPALRAELAQAERDEEWALLVVLAWISLLAVILVVLVLSPWPWGAAAGLVVWGLGARGVFKDFSMSVERTKALRRQVGEMGRTPDEDHVSA
jgi:hypothetical protein